MGKCGARLGKVGKCDCNMRIVMIVLLVIVATLVGAGWFNFMFNSNIEGHHIDPAAIRNK